MDKSTEQLRQEYEAGQIKLEQYQHKAQRLENRIKYYEKGERNKRTHRLCNIGGAIESLAPEIKDFSKTEMYELMEQIFSMPEVRAAVERAAAKERE